MEVGWRATEVAAKTASTYTIGKAAQVAQISILIISHLRYSISPISLLHP